MNVLCGVLGQLASTQLENSDGFLVTDTEVTHLRTQPRQDSNQFDKTKQTQLLITQLVEFFGHRKVKERFNQTGKRRGHSKNSRMNLSKC